MQLKPRTNQVDSKRCLIITIAFIAAKLALHLAFAGNYELHRDELLYFNMADYPDTGYATVPPMIGWLSFIMKSLFGYSQFGLRLISALFSALCMWLIALLIKELKGSMSALIVACTAFLLTPGFLVFHTLFTPNVIEHVLWLWLVFLVVRLGRTKNLNNWYWIGMVVGLALLTKYSVLILAAVLVLSMLFTEHRRLLFSRHFVVSILIALVIFAPNVHWQYQHGWPVFSHMEELERTQLVNMRLTNFFEDLFSLTGLWFLLCLIGIIAMIARNERGLRFLGIASALLFIAFILLRGKAYYFLGVVPALYAVGAISIERYISARWEYALIGPAILLSIASLPFCLPMLSFERLNNYAKHFGPLPIYPFARWEDGNVRPVSQIFADMTGWKELTHLVAKAYNSLSEEDRQRCTIYVQRNYGDAGAINFYGKEYGLPKPITFLESYVLWAPDGIPKGPVIYVYTDPGDLGRLFHKMEEIGTVTDPNFREQGMKVYLYTLPNDLLQESYRETAKEEKAIFRRK